MEKYTSSLPSVGPITRSEPEPAVIETVFVEQEEEATAIEEEEITAHEEQSLNPKRRGSGSGTGNMQQVITHHFCF